jgi:hypothetical protein
MVIGVRLGLLSAVAVVSLIGGCSSASPAARHAPSPGASTKPAATTWQHSPSGKPAGEAAAQELVDLAALPPGGQRLSTSPSPALDRPSSTMANDNFIDHHTWWKVGLSTDELLSYLRGHVPAGMTVSESGGGTIATGQPPTQSLTFGATGPSPGNPALQFTVVAASDRSTWLRIDGQTIWYPPRPTAETAPTDGAVTVSVSRGPTRKVSDLPSVRLLATEFNRLIRTTPGVIAGVACLQNQRTLAISFTKTGAIHPALVTTTTACSVSWSVRGPSAALPALDGGADLRADALRLLGLPANALWSPPVSS